MRLSLLLLACWGCIGHACRCLKPETPEKAWKQAKVIFSGQVVSVQKDDRLGRNAVKVEFELGEAWKGLAGKRMTVFTGQGGGDCGFPFERGQRYLVYASGKESLGTSICTRTAKLDESKSDVSFLKKHAQSKPPPAVDGSPNK